MLIQFSVGNYRSFKERMDLSLVAAKLKAKNEKLNQSNKFNLDESIDLLKSAVIYGGNASGKSNLIKAATFMKNFVLTSSKESQATEEINVENFKLSAKHENLPSLFEIIFFLDGTRYKYGFELDSQIIHKEWLHYVPKERESYLFDRTFQDIKVAQTFKEGKDLISKTRKNALFLSVVAQFNGELSEKILSWFKSKFNIISGLNDIGYREYTVSAIENGTYRDDILSLVKKLDLGIYDIEIDRTEISESTLPHSMPADLKNLLLNQKSLKTTISTIHKKYNVDDLNQGFESFDIDKQESEGTKKLFSLTGPLIDVLKNGKVLIVDELDARLHPLITTTIIELFNSNSTNPNNAQLIFATHDTNLLSNKYFRRDQIWFTEKDRTEATDLYSLAEFQVRNDATYQKDYINGKYGAIPFIGNLDLWFGERVKNQ